jgi:Fe-S-cluster containining protein
MKKKQNTLKRLSYPDDEKSHSWLSMLIDAYFVMNKGVAKAIEVEKKKGRIPACIKGCSNCCITHRDIPVYPLELVGITWYVAEKVAGSERDMLKQQLENHGEEKPCPFLLKGACSIYPMRPIACRQFTVFGKICAEGEDPYYTRSGDVLPLVKKHVDEAFFIMLPFYGVEKESDRLKVVQAGEVHKIARRMQDCNWKSLAEKMHDFDKNRNA